jgi:hypothetical protein
MVNVVAAPEDRHEEARLPTTRPSQSSRTSVSYIAPNAKRSASVRGTGAWAESTLEVDTIVSDSATAAGAAPRAQGSDTGNGA